MRWASKGSNDMMRAVLHICIDEKMIDEMYMGHGCTYDDTNGAMLAHTTEMAIDFAKTLPVEKVGMSIRRFSVDIT